MLIDLWAALCSAGGKLARQHAAAEADDTCVWQRAAGFVATLKRILQRENNWTAWKKAKCPDFKQPVADDGEVQVGDKRVAIWAATSQVRNVFLCCVRGGFVYGCASLRSVGAVRVLPSLPAHRNVYV